MRPTVFFSVPRVYERVWDSIRSNPLGRRYLMWRGRYGTKVLGAFLGRQVLRRAGFDRVSYRNYSGGIAALHSGWKL